MPDSNLPRWGRNAIRTLSTISYGLVAFGGLVGALRPPYVAGTFEQWLLEVSGWALVITATVCALAVAFHRWRIEFLAVWWVGAALVGYVGIAWSQRPITPLTAIFMVLVMALSLTLLSRGLSLAIFEAQTRRARRI